MRGISASENGFTLVELAIVLMIIGLLIGGVLRGQELLSNAQISATAQQVTSYAGALATFSDKYDGIPGDLRNATTRIPGCNSGISCFNGNSDGVVGVLNPGQGQYGNEPWQTVPFDMNSENTQFWKHLALNRIISGVSPGAQTPDWGASHPTAKMGGGFFVRYTNFNVNGYPAWTGHILVLRNRIDGLWTCGSTIESCSVSPKRAAQLDRKMDDGIAMTGDVRAVSANWSQGCGLGNVNGAGANGYAEGSSTNSCDMMFMLY